MALCRCFTGFYELLRQPYVRIAFNTANLLFSHKHFWQNYTLQYKALAYAGSSMLQAACQVMKGSSIIQLYIFQP